MAGLKKYNLLWVFILSLLFSNWACATAVSKPQTDPIAGHVLKVGVILDMPFAQNIDGQYSGIAIDIWQRIAENNHWRYTFVPLSSNTERELTRLSQSNNLDVIIGPISVTASRLQSNDFTRPFFLSSIGIIAAKHQLNILDVLHLFLSKNLFFAILILLASFIVYIHLLWYLERGNLEGVSNRYFSALRKDMWTQLFKKGLTMPTTFYGRVISLLWIIFAAALITSINANYTAAMTVSLSQSNSKITDLQELRRAKVAGVSGQLNTEVAEKNGVKLLKTATFAQAMQLLLDGKVDAVVSDAPIGIEYLHVHGEANYILSSFIFENDELAFAVKLNSPLRRLIDLGIIQMQDNDSIIQLCRRYVGDDASRCDI